MAAEIDLPPELLGTAPDWAAGELDEAILVSENRPEPTRWSITGVDSAEWAMSHLAAVDRQIAAKEQQYQVWKAKLDFWYDDEVRNLKRSQAFFTGLLERWGISERVTNPDQPTLHLPSGEVKTTAHGEKIVVGDERALIGWIETSWDQQAQAAVVVVKKSVLLGELRKRLAIQGGTVIDPTSGEIVPGASVEHSRISVNVRSES